MESETPLHLACATGCIKTAKLLLKTDETIINSENRARQTPACFAAVEGETKMLEFLLKNNARLWTQRHCWSALDSETCLDWAVLNRKPETVKFILEQKSWKEVIRVLC